MAEILVRIVSKTNPDPYLDAKCSKMGDVVSVEEDGHPWSVEERANPAWVLISVTDAVRDDMHSYLAPEPGDPDVDLMLQRRGLKINIETLTLTQPTDLVTLPATTLAHLQDHSFPAEPITDPAVIGDAYNVIG